MSLYGRIFAAMYDRLMAGTEKAGLGDHRQALLADVSGQVLEIGGGTGANLPYYAPDAVDELVLTEPEEPMARRLEAKILDSRLNARVMRSPAERLPFEDASFDAVVSTLVLCTVDDPQHALAEVRRVLKPDGRLLFIEHVLTDDPKLARWQHRLNGLQNRVGHGCNCDRDTLNLIRGAGFAVDDVRHDRLPKAPPIVRPLIIGRAEPRDRAEVVAMDSPT